MTQPAVNPTRCTVVSVRIERGEYARLKLAADDRGISMSELLRRTALRRELPAALSPRLDAEAVGQLRRIGVLLNQSVRLVATWKRSATAQKKEGWQRWQESIEELRTMVASLASKLVQQ